LTVDLKHIWSGKARVTEDSVLGRNAVGLGDGQVDESIALAADAVHDGGTVHLNGAADAEPSRVPRAMGDGGGGEEELAWHAADPRARGALWTVLDEHHARRPGGRGLVRRKPGRSRADDRDVDNAAGRLGRYG